MTDPAILAQLTSIAADDSDVTPGTLGFLIVFVLGVATWLLMKSMNKQFKKVDFPQPEEDKTEKRAASDKQDADQHRKDTKH
jgi:ABC-type nickel/cobalt efflux system permease component RcnA